MKKKTTKLAKVITKKTHISVILDRTGSMQSIKNDIIGGFNSFLGEQKKAKGNMTMTLVQFDSQNPYEVLQNMVSIKTVPELTPDTYVPRDMTPLLDAIGQGISDLETKLATMSTKARPENVVIVIITDGEENASRRFTKEQIEKMIAEKKVAGWQFVFLSSDLSSIGDAKAYGFVRASTLAYDHNANGTKHAFRSLSKGISNYHTGMLRDVSFSDEDRKEQNAETQAIQKKTVDKV